MFSLTVSTSKQRSVSSNSSVPITFVGGGASMMGGASAIKSKVNINYFNIDLLLYLG